MLYSVPPMLLIGLLIWLWLQIMYMGLFRPKSADARAIDIGQEGEKIAAAVIDKRYKELGPITWYESIVGFLFIVVVLLWFFRRPGFTEGWPTYITNLWVIYFYQCLLFYVNLILYITADPSKTQQLQ